MRRLDVAAMGANHGAGLQAALTALERMGGDAMPLAALPNLGLASLAGGRVIYPHATPEYFAEFTAQARSLGAAIVGGCCGTTPIEIASIRAALDEERVPSAPLEVVERTLAVASMAPERVETALARDLREGRFVVSVQIDPPLGGDYTGLLETVEAIRESGSAGYVDINDNATASAKLSAMIMAAAIERHGGVETIPHLTSRDYSVMGLEALLLGGHAEGVRNILAVTGDPPEVGDYPGSKGIYEVDAIGLTQLIAHLNAGQSYNGKPIDAPTSFFIGVAVESDGRRSRARGRPLSPQGGGRRAIRDDADPVRPALPRGVPRADRRELADPRPRRDLPALDVPARAPPPQRGAGHRRAGRASGRASRCRSGSCRDRHGTRTGARAGAAGARPTASTSRRRSGVRSRRSMSW